MTVDALMEKGLNNVEWGVLMFVIVEGGKTSRKTLTTVLSAADFEIDEAVERLESVHAIRVTENGDIVSLIRA